MTFFFKVELLLSYITMSKVNEELAKTYFQVDIKTHAKTKGMWSGSFDKSINEEFLFEDGKFIKRNIAYPQALYKGIDEIIVNAIDQWIKTMDGPKKYKVTKIIIEFTQDGYIKIFNNGNGIPVDVVRNIKGDTIYIPQLVSTEFLAGSNNVTDENRISGGTNGLGIKLTSNNSKHFVLETADIDRKKYFVQESHDRLERIDPPRIQPLRTLASTNIHKKGGTSFRFLPAYDIYGIDIQKEYGELNLLFKTRAIHTAAHTGLSVIYNNESINITNMETFAGLFLPKNEFIYTKLKGKHCWNIVVGLSNTGSYETLSIINGICVKSGTHLNYIRDVVIAGVKSKAEKLLKKYATYKKSMIQNNLFVMISGNISNPAFDSQSKTNISGSATSYRDYTISAPILGKIWKMLEPRLVDQYLTGVEKKSTRRANTNDIKKYKKAKYAGTPKSYKCTLLICEGDSAEGTTRTALTNKKVPMRYDYFGTFNIGGVPMNSRTKTTTYEKMTGDLNIRRQKQLIDNERLSSLEKVLNLSHSKTYFSEEERKSLNYGAVVACVDQDLDGVGQIFGLIMSHFELFWPHLIRSGYVKQFATPIIRAFPKAGRAPVESFYTDEEYRNWEAKNECSRWEIKYYKGLATHNDNETIHMFQKYDKSLHTIIYDDLASETFNIYYGKDPDLRKRELVINRLPVLPINGTISATDHLQSHTREFQLDNIMRKLPHIYDGLNPARRKILCASRKRSSNNNKEVKVFQLAGYVAESMNYHHGSASLEKTIVNMAQNYVGSNNLPLLLPLSQFGSRARGGKDYGAPRYIKTKLNKNLVSAMFRSEDDYLLKYTYDEGERNEPISYVPVAPLILLESLEIPATGWKYAGYARKWSHVYANILSMIKTYDQKTRTFECAINTMPFWNNKWNGETRAVIINENQQMYTVGKYEYDKEKNNITVLELPFQEWNDSYVEKMKNRDYVASVDDDSSKLQINITIKLKPGGFERIASTAKGIPEFDVLEDYCLLKKRMAKNLNIICDGVVTECKTYKEILRRWFHKRYETYVERFKRLRVWTRLKIIFLKEVIRFVKNHKKYNFSILDEPTACKLLNTDNYIKFDKPLLDNPEFTLVDEMEYRVCNCKANYNYLFAIGPKQRMEAARIVRGKKLTELEKYYDIIMSPSIVKSTWIMELQELNDVIKKGTASEDGWFCNEKKHTFK